MRTTNWLGALSRHICGACVAALLLAGGWAIGCKSGLDASQAPDAALGAGGDASQLGGVFGTGGTGGGAVGGGGSGGLGSAGSTMLGSGGATKGSGGATADASDGAGPDAETLPAGQKYIFELHYANFAWSSVHSDYFITADGSVYRAEQRDAGTTVIGAYTHDMTEDQIAAHHPSGATLVGTVPVDLLRAKFSLISSARQGELLSVYPCADYGTFDYVGFVYNSSTGHYDAILLGADGDEAIQNTAPEAQALADWLAGLRTPDAGTVRNCTYAEGCQHGSTCDAADCSVCAGLKMTCVVDKLNKTHCVDSGRCASTDLTCACLGDIVCAGGIQMCAGTVASGFSCAPR